MILHSIIIAQMFFWSLAFITVHSCSNANPVTLLVTLGNQPGKISCKSNEVESWIRALATKSSKLVIQGTKSSHRNEIKYQLFNYKHEVNLLEEEQHPGAGRALQQEHLDLLGDTLVHEKHMDQTPQVAQAGFVGHRDT